MSQALEILVAEDDESDVLLLKRAFRDAAVERRLTFVPDGQAAIEFLEQRGQSEPDRMPALVLLDLKMPRRTGMEVLKWMRGREGLRCVPAFIFSSSSRRDEVEQAYSSGANGYIVKPASTVDRIQVVRFVDSWLAVNQLPLAVTEGLQAARRVTLS
jgi:CheY-like chemotaxis protein